MESERILLNANQDVKPEVVYERKSSIFSPVSLLLCTVFLLAVGGYWMVRYVVVCVCGGGHGPGCRFGLCCIRICGDCVV